MTKYQEIVQRYNEGRHMFRRQSIKVLLDEIERLKAKLEWKPMSDPPKHLGMVVLGDFSPDVIGMSAGIPYAIGWYDSMHEVPKDKQRWVHNGYNPTHYKDCLEDNPFSESED